jgi:hypothetical protein
MKNELRIGNFINCVFSTRHCEVVEITTDDLKLKNGYADYSQIEPIPLTEEWLLKFGFEINVDGYFNHWNFDLHLYLDGDVFESNDLPMYIYLKHVHQLQNLYFALTGEELTLKEI